MSERQNNIEKSIQNHMQDISDTTEGQSVAKKEKSANGASLPQGPEDIVIELLDQKAKISAHKIRAKHSTKLTDPKKGASTQDQKRIKELNDKIRELEVTNWRYEKELEAWKDYSKKTHEWKERTMSMVQVLKDQLNKAKKRTTDADNLTDLVKLKERQIENLKKSLVKQYKLSRSKTTGLI